MKPRGGLPSLLPEAKFENMGTRDSSPSTSPTATEIDVQAEQTKQAWSRSRPKGLIKRGSTVQKLAHGRSHVVAVEIRQPHRLRRRPSR